MSSPTKRPATDRLAENLNAHRQRLGLSFAQVAAKVGVTKGAAHGWEQGAVPERETLDRLAELYGTTVQALRYEVGTPAMVREPTDGSYLPGFMPNPALRRRLPPKPYARVYEHIAQMEAAACTTEQIEEAERLMIDGAYNKLNARDPRDRTDDEMILDIDDAWDWIKEVLGRTGVKGLG